MIKLTKNETAVYAAIETATTVDDITVIADMKKAAVLGVLASMVKKGAAQSVMDGEVKMYSRTEAEVELHVEQVVEQPQETPTAEVESKEEESKEEESKEPVQPNLDPNKFKKDGTPRKVTNAMLIREEIAKVKETMSKEEAIAHVIMFGMEVIGQSKQLAKKYVTENYDKV